MTDDPTIDDLLAEVTIIAGTKVLVISTPAFDLRGTASTLMDRMGSGVLFLAGVTDDEVWMVAMVSKDLVERVHAGRWLGAVTKASGGRGGGRPDMAQGRGVDPANVSVVLGAAFCYAAKAMAGGLDESQALELL